MSFSSQFRAGGIPLGTAIQGLNLQEPHYVRADGRAIPVAQWGRLSTLFPVRQFQGTVRNLAGVPINPSVAASNGTYFVTVGSSTADNIQYSTDGVTWTLVNTASSISCSAFIATPTRWVAVSSVSSSPIISANTNPSSTWATSTSSPIGLSVWPGRLSYSPTLSMVVLCADTALYTLAEGSTTWVTRSAGSNNKQSGCWTGSRFLVIGPAQSTMLSSTDGATWVTSPIPQPTAASQGCIASNGAGVVVLSGATAGLQVSTDHGQTWRLTSIPGIVPDIAWRVLFSDDRFLVSTSRGIAQSLDGLNWFTETTPVQAMTTNCGLAKKGGTIVQITSTATAWSFASPDTHFYVPNLCVTSSGNASTEAPWYIKAS